MCKQIKLGAKYMVFACVMLQAFCMPLQAGGAANWLKKTFTRRKKFQPGLVAQEDQKGRQNLETGEAQATMDRSSKAVRDTHFSDRRDSRNIDDLDTGAQGAQPASAGTGQAAQPTLADTGQGSQLTSEHVLYGATAAAVVAGAYGMWSWWQGNDKKAQGASIDDAGDGARKATRRVQSVSIGPVSMSQMTEFDQNDLIKCVSLNESFLKSLSKETYRTFQHALRGADSVQASRECNPLYYVACLSGNTLTDVQKKQLQKAVSDFVNVCLQDMAMNDLVTKFYELMAELTADQYTDHLFKACARFIKKGDVAYFVSMQLSGEQASLRSVFVEAAAQRNCDTTT